MKGYPHPMPGLLTVISRDHKMNITAEVDPEMPLQPFLPVHRQEIPHTPVQGIWEAL
jgi:hypothetical protein